MASEIVHITFEKLTGLKGTIEGVFRCNPSVISVELPLVFQADEIARGLLIFEQGDEMIFMCPQDQREYENYREHLVHGTNFLIKEWSYGRGERSTISRQSLN